VKRFARGAGIRGYTKKMFRLVLFILSVVCIGCGGSASAPVAENKLVETAPKAEAAAPIVTDPSVAPETIFFASEYGNVTFGHRKHFERVNNDCATCHPKIFPQTRETLNYGKARHRSAEEYGTSCASCHGIKGTAFAAERNCQKCHEMGLPKR